MKKSTQLIETKTEIKRGKRVKITNENKDVVVKTLYIVLFICSQFLRHRLIQSNNFNSKYEC